MGDPVGASHHPNPPHSNRKKDFFVKFNVEGLLRGDYQSRMEGYALARQNGWMSANDIRALENLDRIPTEAAGDEYLVNGNMLPLSMAGAYATQPQSPVMKEKLFWRRTHECENACRA